MQELVSIPEVKSFFTEARLGDATRHVPEGGPVLQVPIRDMITRQPITIDVAHSVREAALIMTEHRISAIIVVRNGDELAGILTDRDLRKVVADGIDFDAPLTEVMSSQPFTIGSDALALDVLLQLVTHKIHHLPVTDEDNHLKGFVSISDLIRHCKDTDLEHDLIDVLEATHSPGKPAK